MNYDWLDERVEAYVDGELSGADLERFEAGLTESADLRTAVATARRIREVMASVPLPQCPEPAVADVLRLASESRRSLSMRDRYIEALRPRRRLVQVFAVAAVVAIGGSLILRDLGPQNEVEQGLADVKLALAYVGEAGRQAGDIVRIEVVDEGVVRPIRRAVSHVTGEDVNGRSQGAAAVESTRDN
ncbi:MAG: hypothetical protein KJO98_06365 [Rhodothermia bacterium]|nr:hypothetical protein [Rhodothermia bacterium]